MLSKPSLLLSLALLSAACGGGNGASKMVGPAPVFSSTPNESAAQGVPYTYRLEATDPAGGTVRFALTTGPSGAIVLGDTVAWTPTASQSRISNAFTVTATTSSGGTATQSWTVSPAGTVTVTAMNTNWTSTGTVSFPAMPPVEAAMVPNADGSITVAQGSLSAPGVASIPNVPAGYYWLATGLDLKTQFNAFWTNASSIDLGQDYAGPSTPILTTPQTTILDFQLGGLVAASPANPVVFLIEDSLPFEAQLQPQAGSITLTEDYSTTGFGNLIDWAQIGEAMVAQYEPVALDSLSALVLGPTDTLSDLSLANGSANSVVATLQSGPTASVDVNVAGTHWAGLFQNASPSRATPEISWLSIGAEPYVSKVIASGAYIYFAASGLSYGPFGTACTPYGISSSGSEAIVTDQDFGVLQYSDPLPTSWMRTLTFCEQASTQIQIPGSRTVLNFAFADGETEAVSSSPITPIVSQVQNATIDGARLLTAATLNTTVPTLSWTAPATGTPYGYKITPYQITVLSNEVEFAPAGSFETGQASATLPPLTPAATYIFLVQSLADDVANVATPLCAA